MPMQNLLAEVVVDIPARRVDRVFHYRIPSSLKNLVQEGVRVEVPFGARRGVEGFVVGITGEGVLQEISASGAREFEVKDISRVVDEVPPVTADLLALARWMSAYYLCPLILCLQGLLPQGVKRGQAKEKTISSWRLAKEFGTDKDTAAEINITVKQRQVLDVLRLEQPLTTKELCARAVVGPQVLKTMDAKNYIEKVTLVALRDPWNAAENDNALVIEGGAPANGLTLTSEQNIAVRAVVKALGAGKEHTFLLHGITGSGKTEVYLQAIAKTLDLGRQAILLVPEISLTPQMVNAFKSRFPGQVAILHSRLSAGERFDQWQKIRKGDIKVVVGARSAIFAPLPDLGLIIIDEEHETSYKQEESPRYHTRDVAIKRAGLCRAVVLLGSATPSLESFSRAGKKEYTLLTLAHRIEGRPLPPVTVVDMRSELQEGNRSIFSRLLTEKIKDRIDRGEQTILFLNRRGFATFVVCRECGLALKCPRCAVSLTYHSKQDILCCHYCRFMRRVPSTCPRCGSRHIRYFGTGTQKVEEYLSQEIPGARILRMDVDTTRRKGAHGRILSAFTSGEADILVGTQMIAKGLDIPLVTLVGVITADTSLNMPDFRAAERTFQLLTQVAGRAGRGEAGGEVVVQTYMPDHYSIKTAQNHDFKTFYRLEMAQRRAFDYPPMTHVARIIISGPDENMVRDVATRLGEHFRSGVDSVNHSAAGHGDVFLLGPAPAPIPRIKEKYRWNMILLGADPARLREEITAMMLSGPRGRENVSVIIDIDAQGML